MKIHHKLQLGFLTISVLIAVVGIFSIINNNQISQDITQLVESSMKEYDGAVGMASTLKLAHYSARELLVTKNHSEMNSNEAKQFHAKQKALADVVIVALTESEQWLQFSLLATQTGILVSEQIEEAMMEEEELNHLKKLSQTYQLYHKAFAEFIVLTNTDLASAASWMDTELQPIFINLIQDVEYYQADAKKEMFAEGEEVEQSTEFASRVLTAVTIIGILTAIAAGAMLSRIISSPIVSLTDATLKFGEDQSDISVKLQQNDELGYLAQCFNSMVIKINNTNQRLQLAKGEAEKANQSKSQFLSRMSHELRTPLNAILGFAQVQQLTQTKNANAQQQECTKYIIEAGHHLLGLVNDMLDIEKLEQGELDIPLQSCDLNQVIHDCIKLVEHQTTELGITLVNQPTSLYALTNVQRLKQVIINLLTNGIKYNQKAGSVTIQVKEVVTQCIEISIKDSGIGIALEDKDLIFEPFTRLAYAEHQEIQGTGIGLALVKFLVEQMNGTIDFNSELGVGTEFLLRFPKGQSLLSNKPEQDLPISNHHLTANEHIILYIEDNPASQQLMTLLLKMTPEIKLIICTNGEDGIKTAAEKVPDIIFIDINLPGINGFEVLTSLKSITALKHTAIIALSADAMQHQINQALSDGFDQYITKPIDINEMSSLIQHLLSKAPPSAKIKPIIDNDTTTSQS